MFKGVIDIRIGKLFYLVKIFRLYNGFSLLNHKAYMTLLKKKINSKIQWILNNDRVKSED